MNVLPQLWGSISLFGSLPVLLRRACPVCSSARLVAGLSPPPSCSRACLPVFVPCFVCLLSLLLVCSPALSSTGWYVLVCLCVTLWLSCSCPYPVVRLAGKSMSGEVAD